MDSPDQKRTVRDFVTVVLNGIAFLAFGLGMTGWLSPFLGVGVMSIAVFYWAWEISTAPFVTEHLGRAERLTLTLILITSVFFFCGPGIYRKLHTTPDIKSSDVIPVPKSGENPAGAITTNQNPKLALPETIGKEGSKVNEGNGSKSIKPPEAKPTEDDVFNRRAMSRNELVELLHNRELKLREAVNHWELIDDEYPDEDRIKRQIGKRGITPEELNELKSHLGTHKELREEARGRVIAECRETLRDAYNESRVAVDRLGTDATPIDRQQLQNMKQSLEEMDGDTFHFNPRMLTVYDWWILSLTQRL